MGGGYDGEGSKTIIPAEARAKITIRIVPRQDPEKIRRAVEKFLRIHAPDYVDLQVQFSAQGSAYGISLPHSSLKFRQLFQLAEDALGDAFASPPLHLREGGSIGVVSGFREILGLDSILLGLVPPSSRIHSPNENWSVDGLLHTQQAFQIFLQRANQLS
jgi:acetylornithine deacetylase/succinyl-diaminopimelate desuccinylase-like protein